MKKNNVKVGRPKLADSKLKKESLLVCLFVFVIMVIVGIIGFNILMIDLNPKYLIGSVYNNNVNSCKIENNYLKCGPNVVYLKYSYDKDKYKEINKSDQNIKIRLKKSSISYCYKTYKNELNCNK